MEKQEQGLRPLVCPLSLQMGVATLVVSILWK